MSWNIDLNCDLGEGIGFDAQIMPFISSCNIASGGHYGTIETMKECLSLAQKHQVKVGAHPSFDDKENFGRVRLDWSRSRFRESVTHQLKSFTTAASAMEMNMHHIKMHGALYHATAHESDYASWTVELLQELFPEMPIYSLPNSVLEQECKKAGHPFIAESFADRAYKLDGSLVARARPESVLKKVEQVADQLIYMVQKEKVRAINGVEIPLNAETYCIHGDNIRLVEQMPRLVAILKENQISIG
jgi:UPF0271 protein